MMKLHNFRLSNFFFLLLLFFHLLALSLVLGDKSWIHTHFELSIKVEDPS